MLVVHSDDRQSGDGRAMVHNAGHNLADECWVIVSVEEQGVSLGYTIMKSQVFAFLQEFEIRVKTYYGIKS